MVAKVRGALKHFGSKGLNRANVLEILVHAHGWTHGVELGVWRGDVQDHLLRHCPTLRMVGVDWWKCHPPTQQDKHAKDWPYLNEKAMRDAELRAHQVKGNHPGRCELVHSDTVEAASLYRDRTFDFVFVDAGHELDNVRNDINAWRNKIRPGGAMLGHDLDWWSVEQAVSECFDDEYHVLPDKVWITWIPGSP